MIVSPGLVWSPSAVIEHPDLMARDVLDCFSLRQFDLSLLTQNFCVGLAYPGWFLFSSLEAESPLQPLLFFWLPQHF